MLVAPGHPCTSRCAVVAMLVSPATSRRTKRRASPGTSRMKSCAAVAFTTRNSRAVARAYLAGVGMTLIGETARASGLGRVEAGCGNYQLGDEGYAIRIRQGVYALASSSARSARQHKAWGASPRIGDPK